MAALVRPRRPQRDALEFRKPRLPAGYEVARQGIPALVILVAPRCSKEGACGQAQRTGNRTCAPIGCRSMSPPPNAPHARQRADTEACKGSRCGKPSCINRGGTGIETQRRAGVRCGNGKCFAHAWCRGGTRNKRSGAPREPRDASV